MARTFFDKVWDAHVVESYGDDWALLHVDRILLHDLSGSAALRELDRRGLGVPCPELVASIPDHAISSAPGRTPHSFALGGALYDELRRLSQKYGIRFFAPGAIGQGIVHVVGPELGLTLPGTVIVCGDSHTCTHGGLGAIGFGIGTQDCVHALATQTLRQKKPRQMRITVDGVLGHGVTPKDLILHIIGRLGADAGAGYAIEFAGPAIRALPVDARLTICNLAVELGARYGFIAPDETVFAYLEGRSFAPQGAMFDRALRDWRPLATDEGAAFDREYAIDAAEVGPTISWGTSPEHVIAVDGSVPDPAAEPDEEKRRAHGLALAYMGLKGGQALAGTSIDWVFIGSCTNSRLSDLRDAAAIVRGRCVADHVTAWIVPGSEQVKRDAEAEGLDRLFRDAGFEWREPSCSLCVAANGEAVPPYARVVSTSNRNFVGRQGPNARTHLASPAMAAAAAVTGRITDVRTLL